MNAKYIGFDIDSKKTVACVVQQGQKDRYSALVADLQDMLTSPTRHPGGAGRCSLSLAA